MEKVLVVGSLAFDVIFAIHGNIKNEIVNSTDPDSKLSMMFTAGNKASYFGGTAGNIAYGLGKLNVNPYMFSVAGSDFKHSYETHLQNLGVNCNVIIPKVGDTATFYGISDEEYQQIGIWQPAVYGDTVDTAKLSETLSTEELKSIRYAIFSPGRGISTRNHILEFRQKSSQDSIVIFDPSQVLSIFYDKPLLIECLTLSNILIGNETEISQLQTLFQLSFEEIYDYGISLIVETKGGDGVVMHTKEGSTQIPAHTPKKVVETTGAGDAFRAGFLYGLANGYDNEKAAKIGTFVGAKSVEEMSGQLYDISIEELNKFLGK